MTSRWLTLLILIGTAALAADQPSSATNTVEQAATALGSGDAAGFTAAFDPAMPGLAALRSAATELVQQADVQSTVQFHGESGDSRSRTLQMDWTLRIVEREASKAVTTRQARVTCRVNLRGGQWRIAGIEPAGFFAPPHVEGAWNALQSAAARLNDGNAAGFLAYFDPAMPDYDKVRSGAVALVAEGEVQSAIELNVNEGTDTTRTLEVDWTLQIVNEDTQISQGRREQHLKCRMELQGNQWRITHLDQADFFGPILLGVNFPHHGDSRRGLLDSYVKRGRAAWRNVFHLRTDRAQA